MLSNLESADDTGCITWGMNLANDLSERRHYKEASKVYEQAFEAAINSGESSDVVDVAERWCVSLRKAHHRKHAGELLIKAARGRRSSIPTRNSSGAWKLREAPRNKSRHIAMN